MGAGMMFILLLIVIGAVIAAMVFTGAGTALWTKKTAPPESAAETDTETAGELPASETDDAGPPAESTVVPDANGRYHREFQ